MGKTIDKKINFTEKGEKVGEALLRDYLDGEIFLTNFEIVPEFRHKGLGKKCLQKLISDYNVNSLVVLVDNKIAFHLYREFGFKIIKSPYYDKPCGGNVYYMKR